MTNPDTINALVVALRVLARPSHFRVTDAEVLAMAGCLVGLDEQIDQMEQHPLVLASAGADGQLTTNARLAAAVARVLQLDREWDAAEAACDAPGASDEVEGNAAGDALIALSKSIDTLRTIFEQEFPNV